MVNKKTAVLLINRAKKARANSYSPYSKFKVGACVLGGSGAMYDGVNVENSSFGLTVCAERSALSSAVTAGEKKVAAVAVYAGENAVLPCGACLQALSEFGSGTEVFTVDARGRVKKTALHSLLPKGFKLK